MNRTKSITSGFLWLLLSNAWTWGLGLVEVAIVPRILGPTNYGKLSLAASILGAATIFVTFGGGAYVVRTISSKPQAADRFLCAMLAYRTAVGVPVAAAIFFTMRALVHDPLILSLIAITSVNAYLGWVYDAVSSYRQANTHFGTVARSQMIAKSAGVISRITLVTHNMGPMGAAAGDTIQSITGITSLWFARAGKIRITRVYLDDIKTLLAAGAPYFKYSFYLWVYGAPTTTYILVYCSGYEANGWFTVAMRLLGLFYIVPGLLVNVLMPLLVRAYEESVHEYQSLAKRTLGPALVICVPFSLLLIIQPHAILRALHYTSAFDNVALPLQIAGANLLFRWASSYFGMLLVACNRIEKQARAAMIAAPFNLITTAVLVTLFQRYYHNGAAGAMLASEITEMLVVYIYISALRDQPIVKHTLTSLARGLVAGIVPAMILLIPMTGRASFLCIFALALMAFIPCAFLTRAIRMEDIRPFIDVMRTKTQGKPKPPESTAV